MISKNLKVFFFFLAFFSLKCNLQEKSKNSKFVNKIMTSVLGLLTNGYLAIKSESQESKKVACIGFIQGIKEIVEAVSENFFQKEENNLDETKRYNKRPLQKITKEIFLQKKFFGEELSPKEKILIKVIISLLKNKKFIFFLKLIIKKLNIFLI